MMQKEKMLQGELYVPFGDKELAADYKKCKKFLRVFNATTEEEAEKRAEILKSLWGKTGDKPYVEPPFYCDYGCNIYVGDNFYANYDCIILDTNRVVIGNNVLFGPRVCVFAAQHPTDPEVRRLGVETSAPVTIGNDVWIGGNTVINPGVCIGNNVIVGSGSVVTRNIPDNVIAAGNPCRILREITDEDKKFWQEKLERYRQSLSPAG